MENIMNAKNITLRIAHYLSIRSKKKSEGASNSLFTTSQKLALVTVTFAALWATLSLVMATLMDLQSTFALTIFGFMTLLAWILIPLYFKRKKAGYILGTVLLILGLFGLFASPGNPAWYTSTNPISIVKELSFFIDSISGVYFSYKSFREVSCGDAFYG
jgi:hypothetical protein